MVRPAAKREGVAHLQAELGLSERRTCSIVNADRPMVRYRSRRPPDTELRTQLRELANERKRFGYRRLFVLLRQQGEPSGINRIYRLYREEGLTVRKRALAMEVDWRINGSAISLCRSKVKSDAALRLLDSYAQRKTMCRQLFASEATRERSSLYLAVLIGRVFCTVLPIVDDLLCYDKAL